MNLMNLFLKYYIPVCLMFGLNLAKKTLPGIKDIVVPCIELKRESESYQQQDSLLIS